MSQAILISDNEVINSLYEVNLRAYVATNVTIKSNFDSALRLLEESPNIDAVISFRELGSGDGDINTFLEQLKQKGLNTPLIILGESDAQTENTIIIKNRYDIKALLKAMAKILQITAKDMAALEVPEYFPIPLRIFNQMTETDFDIYFRTKKTEFEYEYFKIIEKDTEIEPGLLLKYMNEGVEHLYVDAAQRLSFISIASREIVSELNRSDITTEEKLEIVSQGMGIVAEEIFESDDISENVAKISASCIKAIRQTIQDVPKLKNILQMLMESKSDYCYKHSVIATYVATQIIDNISWGSDEQKKKVAFAFFFHDIYLLQVYKKYPKAMNEEDLLFNDDVEDEDKQIVLEHAKKAGHLVKTFPKCPMGADMIVTQHHGMTSGEGFAVNYKDDISPLSKIMIISEEVAYNILLTASEQEGKISVNKKVILEHLSEKYKNHTYKKIITAFEEAEI